METNLVLFGSRLADETVIVRVRSHRAANRLKTMLGVNKLSWYWNMREGNSFAAIPSARLAEARTIPGVSLARPKYELMRCWDWI